MVAIAYSQGHEKLSAGSVLYYLVLEDLYAHDTPGMFDMGQGKSGQKVSLRGIESVRLPMYFTDSRLLAALVLIQREMERLESRIRALLLRTGPDRRVRRKGLYSVKRFGSTSFADSVMICIVEDGIVPGRRRLSTINAIGLVRST